MDYGKKASQPGYDVKTATDKNLIFSTKFNSLKISSEGATTLSVPHSTTATKTIAHGLSYAPSHYVFVKELTYGGSDYWICDGGGAFQLPIYDPSGATDAGTMFADQSHFTVYTDATNLYIEIKYQSYAPPSDPKVFDIYYYILIEDNA